MAGCFGIVGFTISILAGMYADNGFAAIIGKAMLAMVVCYVVGWMVGSIGQYVAAEQAQRIAAQVAVEDAEAAAKKRAEAAAKAEREATAEVVAAVPAASGT